MAGIGDRGVALDHPFSAVGHGDVPVAEVAAYVPGGGSGAAAMALAVRSHHSAITAFSSAGYAAAMQALLTATQSLGFTRWKNSAPSWAFRLPNAPLMGAAHRSIGISAMASAMF